jgi:hypothetical protein
VFQYYTLAAPREYRDELSKAIVRMGIDYRLSADFLEDIELNAGSGQVFERDSLILMYRVCIDKETLTAIRLSVPSLYIVENRRHIKILNSLRRLFSWTKSNTQ